MTVDDLQTLVTDYNRGVAEVDSVIAAVPAALMDASIDGEWSPRMVIHHLADSETNSYVRLRRLLAEESGTTIQGYDEARWAKAPELGYESAPIEESLAVFRAVRAASSAVLARLSLEDFSRRGVHTDSGDYSLQDWLRIYAAHALEHADQIRRAATN
ncbi:MAG: hypothetical protein EBS41_03500 [Actinobacteria bacterium]|jgi:hypothetical protein|nr:hypothetical protein [Actinomycetota bacterium]